MRPRHTKIRDQRDANHGEIVAFLRTHGLEVIETERPLDCLVFNDTEAGWMEIKTESRNATVRRSQLEFMSETAMPVAIVKNEGEALIFALTMEGLTPNQKDALTQFLVRDQRDVYYPATVETILNEQK